MIQLSKGQTYYEVYGDDGDWIVFLHGITIYSFGFHDVVQPIIKKGYRVLLFDFYGRGESDAPDVNYDMNLFVGQAKELMDALQIGKAHIVGFSMGGAVAVEFIGRHSQMVDKLILVAPAAVPANLPLAAKVITMPYLGWTLYAMLGKKMMLQKLRTDRLSDDFFDGEKSREVIDKTVARLEWLINEKEGFLRAFHSTLCHMPVGPGMIHELHKVNDVIKTTNSRVYLIWGEHDRIIPFHNSSVLLDIIPTAQLEVIKEAGHSCAMEKPAETAAALIGFFEDGRAAKLPNREGSPKESRKEEDVSQMAKY